MPIWVLQMGPGELIDPIQGRPWKELICDSTSDGNLLRHVGAFSMHQKLEVARGSNCSFGLGIVWACLKVPFSSTVLASEHVSMEPLEYLHRNPGPVDVFFWPLLQISSQILL